MKLNHLLLFGILFAIYLPSANAQEASNPALITFETVISTMKSNYFDQKYNGLEWDKLVAETREKIKNEKDSSVAYNEIKLLLKKLGHSHLEFSPPGSIKSKEEEHKFKPTGAPKELPFQFEIFEEQLLITTVDGKSDAFQNGLRPGMLVQQIADMKVKDLLLKESVHAYFYFPLFMYPEETLPLQGVTHKKEPFQIKFKLDFFKGKLLTFGNIQGYPSDFESKILEKNIGYVRFNIFLFEPVTNAIKAIKSMKDCAGIIIDVRNNPGGIGNLASAIAKEFCDKNYQLGTQNTTANNGVGEMRFPVQAQKSPFKGKVVILINGSSASTSEILAIGMQENKSAVIVGTKSPGLALPSLILKLDDGSIFQYPVADFKTPNNQSLEGIGVKPDFEVKLTPEKIAEGQDEQINKAVEIILQSVTTKPN